jgi:hypothetical protein
VELIDDHAEEATTFTAAAASMQDPSMNSEASLSSEETAGSSQVAMLAKVLDIIPISAPS